MRSALLLIGTSLVFALAVCLIPNVPQSQAFAAPALQSGSDVLAQVNALRASQGLSAYNANSILMQIAQAQADYLAATGGSVGHSGPGGTTPKQRALAAGYAATFFSENWISGSGMSPSGAVSWWQGDAEHLGTMLSSSLVDAGAGVSKSGSVVYYVLDAGATGSSSEGDTTGPTVPAGTVQPSQFMVPVTVNTPGPDGLVYHEVAYGQSLWSIAIAYGTKIEVIKALNNLGDIDIYVGQKLLILRGPTPAPVTATAADKMATGTLRPATATLAVTATERALQAPTGIPSVAPTQPATQPVRSSLNLTAIAIIGAALLFAVLGTWAGTHKAV
jgi:LysM repeat protein